MQRRLTIALIGTALAAIIFVGAGVLGFAQLGAERQTRQAVGDQLEALAELAESSGSVDRVGPILQRIGDAFDVRSVRVGLVSPEGEILLGRNRNAGPSASIALGPQQLETLLAGDPLIEKVRGHIRGIQRLDLENELRRPAVVLIESDIATIGNQARLWFLISGAIVLTFSALLASWLAKRFTAPVRLATQTTASIAAGDLSARMRVDGEDELAELGTGINRMATELERGRAAEQQFLLSVSHDLRTPLTAISGYAEALEDGTTTDQRRVGEIIHNHADRLERLVGDLLDLAKLDTRQFRFDNQIVDVGDLAERVAIGHRPDTEQRELQLDVDVQRDVWIEVDPDRVAQIIGNLIDNAAKFAGSRIRVSVTRGVLDEATHAPSAIISVLDDGPGIRDEDLSHVFERLYVTQHRPRRAESSSGLGLAIVRELATAMGGQVVAGSTLGEGTEMRVIFPLAGPRGETAQPQ